MQNVIMRTCSCGDVTQSTIRDCINNPTRRTNRRLARSVSRELCARVDGRRIEQFKNTHTNTSTTCRATRKSQYSFIRVNINCIRMHRGVISTSARLALSLRSQSTKSTIVAANDVSERSCCVMYLKYDDQTQFCFNNNITYSCSVIIVANVDCTLFKTVIKCHQLQVIY